MHSPWIWIEENECMFAEKMLQTYILTTSPKASQKDQDRLSLLQVLRSRNAPLCSSREDLDTMSWPFSKGQRGIQKTELNIAYSWNWTVSKWSRDTKTLLGTIRRHRTELGRCCFFQRGRVASYWTINHSQTLPHYHPASNKCWILYSHNPTFVETSEQNTMPCCPHPLMKEGLIGSVKGYFIVQGTRVNTFKRNFTHVFWDHHWRWSIKKRPLFSVTY